MILELELELEQLLFNRMTMMMFNLFICLFLIITTTNIVQGATGNNPTINIGSPCPNIFQYNWDGLEWHGTIIAPSVPYGTAARLVARLSIGRVLPTKYAGNLELTGPRAEVLHAMLSEQPIRYRVNFPLPHPLPLLTAITLNDRLICSGPTVSGPIVTSITLEHTLYPHGGQALNSRDQIPGEEQHFGPDSNLKTIPTNITNQTSSSSFPNENRNNKPMINSIEKNILIDVCGSPVSTTPLIANGEATKRGSYPWLVALFTQKSLGLEFTCGGTLISNRFVLTAAHCIRYGENRALSAEEIVLFLGKYHIRRWTERGSIVREAIRITMHPEYRALSGDADLAAIELADVVSFTDTIRPVCITEWPRVADDLATTEGIIVGWGRDETGLKVTPEPHQVHVQIVSQEDCLRSRLEFRYITSNRTLCAGGVHPGSGPCSGDSGGGLFVKNTIDGKWHLKGVISMSLADPVSKSCDLNHYSVFVDVGKFTEWIRQFLI